MRILEAFEGEDLQRKLEMEKFVEDWGNTSKNKIIKLKLYNRDNLYYKILKIYSVWVHIEKYKSDSTVHLYLEDLCSNEQIDVTISMNMLKDVPIVEHTEFAKVLF